MRVACLCPSDFFDYGRVFTDIMADRSDTRVEAETWTPHHGHLPDEHGFDAVIVSGSEHHVYDRQDWVGEMQAYLDRVLDHGVPVLGVCYGHQLLGDMLGGTVERMPEREMGYRAVRLTPGGERHPLFAGVPEVFTAFQSHLDTVTALPPAAEALAENNHGVQAFSHPRGAYGIQFHPEYSLEMAEALLAEKDMGDEQRERVRATFTEENAENAVVTRRVFDNLLHMAAD